MRQIGLGVVLMAALAGLAVGAITVTSPNGGEVWYRNGTRTITWNHGGHGGNVVIKLYKNGADLGRIVESTPNNGSYSWRIGTLTDGTPIEDAATYKVRIRVIGQDYYDLSDNNFSIQTLVLPREFVLVAVPFLGKKPDLRMTIAVSPFSMSRMTTVTYTVHNDGDAAAPSTILRSYLYYRGESGGPLPGSWNEYWEFTTPSVPAGESRQVTKTTNAFHAGNGGQWTIRADLDFQNLIKEKNEENNGAEHTFWITH